MTTIGEKDNLQFEIGDEFKGGLLEVWISSKDVSLTPVDQWAYLSSFTHCLVRDRALIAAKKDEEPTAFFQYGPTTDDVCGKISVLQDRAVMTFETQGEKLNVSIKIDDLLEIYDSVITCLKNKH